MIAVCTYRRTTYLGALLSAMECQVVPEGWHTDILVVDNDPEQSARQTTDSISAQATPIPIQYVCEPRAGVANARNRALTDARRCADCLIFFDDDQMPDPDWLEKMLAASIEDATAVWSGPVLPMLPKDIPSWARDLWAWSRPELRHGAALLEANGGNLLIPRKALELGVDFADPFKTGMGEDTGYTRTLCDLGIPIKYAATAIGYEHVPKERLKISWVLARARRSSETWARMELSRPGGKFSLASSFMRNAVMAVWEAFSILTTRKSAHAVKCLRRIAILGGYLAALLPPSQGRA
jgi:succinoglycan biosynthesis protein ExoM